VASQVSPIPSVSHLEVALAFMPLTLWGLENNKKSCLDGLPRVTTPNVKNHTFRTVAKTCRHPEAKCNTFPQREIQAFSVESRFVAKTLVSAILPYRTTVLLAGFYIHLNSSISVNRSRLDRSRWRGGRVRYFRHRGLQPRPESSFASCCYLFIILSIAGDSRFNSHSLTASAPNAGGFLQVAVRSALPSACELELLRAGASDTALRLVRTDLPLSEPDCSFTQPAC
jgi:hypothetical protein